jgi:hypothetical protein
MSAPVPLCPVISISYKYVGNTFSQHSFHLFNGRIPDMSILSHDDHPSPSLSIIGVPDDS